MTVSFPSDTPFYEKNYYVSTVLRQSPSRGTKDLGSEFIKRHMLQRKEERWGKYSFYNCFTKKKDVLLNWKSIEGRRLDYWNIFTMWLVQ